MTRREFKKFIEDRLTADGFTKVKVKVSLLGKRARITANGPNGRSRKIEAELIRRRSKEIVRLDTVDKAWMDELEMLAAKPDE